MLGLPANNFLSLAYKQQIFILLSKFHEELCYLIVMLLGKKVQLDSSRSQNNRIYVGQYDLLLEQTERKDNEKYFKFDQILM